MLICIEFSKKGAIMTFIKKLWDKITKTQSVLYPVFSIPKEHIIGSQAPDVKFKADEAYFELRICEQFLRDKREYWNEYNPLTLVISEFIYDKQKRSIPFVVGPKLLEELAQFDKDNQVRYHNTRVVGPTPYAGGDVAFFIGLFRIKTKDWARQALSLLETFAKAFDSSKLSNYLNIATPLMDGIESFFGMGKQMEFRLGERNVFSDGANAFSPNYFVFIRDDEKKIKREQFWVKDDRLYSGDKENELEIYKDKDYILYQINYLEKRNDYETFEFHKQWDNVQKSIWEGNWEMNKEHLISSFQQLIYLIRCSPDLISKQKKQLQLYYTGKFQEEQITYELSKNPMGTLESSDAIIIKAIENVANIDNNFIIALGKSWDYFRQQSINKPKTDKPIILTEADIQSALDSILLNDSSIKNLDLDKLTFTLNAGITKILD